MFGKEFAFNIDILTESFKDMNDQYKEKVISEKNSHLHCLKEYYISLFGIPEIGFQIRNIYFNKIINSFISSQNLKQILDAGSGIGAYTFWLAKKFPKSNVIGGEIDQNKLKASRLINRAIKHRNVSFVHFDATKKQNKSKYDLIIVIDVLEHIKDYKKVLENFYRLLNRNGYLYIHVPQPNQKRIFKSLKSWQHEDHIHEGIDKKTLGKILNKIGYKIKTEQETFGFFGRLAWEINHITLSKNFIIAGITFPLLYSLAIIDSCFKNKKGLGVAMLAQKK